MAYTRGFEYDVFLSYSQANNHSGWVNRFEEMLTARLRERLSNDIRVFLDSQSLQGNQELTPELQRVVASSAVFVPIVSRSYIQRPWCRSECQAFQAANPNRNWSGRIFPARYDDVSPLEYQKLLGVEVRGYEFFGATERGNAVSEFDTESKEFKACLLRLRDHLGKQLESMHNGRPVSHETAEATIERRPDPIVSESLRVPYATRTSDIELTLDRDFDEFTEAEKNALVDAIRRLLSIRGNVRVVQIQRGSVKLILRLESADAEALLNAVNQGKFEQFRIVFARFVDSVTSPTVPNTLLVPKRTSAMSPEPKKIFISYAEPDRPAAFKIAAIVRDAGYPVVFDQWSFPPGSDFVGETQRALIDCERMVAVLSRAYLQRPYTKMEYNSFLTRDPAGDRGLLLPVRVEDFSVDGIFASRVYIDFVGKAENQCHEELLAALERRPHSLLIPRDNQSNLPIPDLRRGDWQELTETMTEELAPIAVEIAKLPGYSSFGFANVAAGLKAVRHNLDIDDATRLDGSKNLDHFVDLLDRLKEDCLGRVRDLKQPRQADVDAAFMATIGQRWNRNNRKVWICSLYIAAIFLSACFGWAIHQNAHSASALAAAVVVISAAVGWWLLGKV